MSTMHGPIDPMTHERKSISDRTEEPARLEARKSSIGLERARYCLSASRYRIVSRTGCRLWRQAKNRKGYAVATDALGTYLVTRALFQYVHGALPPDVHLAYCCGNHACINLAHVRPLPIVLHPGRRANARVRPDPTGLSPR